MKSIALFALLLLLGAAATAQPPAKRKVQPAPPAYRQDSLLEIKSRPVAGNTQTRRTTTPKRVNNTKLDDLKNPFDTAKSVQPRQTNFSWGATHGEGNAQNQRVKPNTGRKPGRYVDSNLVKQPSPATVQHQSNRQTAGNGAVSVGGTRAPGMIPDSLSPLKKPLPRRRNN